jgi:hypothetical protein
MFSFAGLKMNEVHPNICVAVHFSDGQAEFSPFAPFEIFEPGPCEPLFSQRANVLVTLVSLLARMVNP